MRDKVNWSLTAFAGAAQMHVGPLSRLNEESGELGTDSSHSSGNLPVVANVKIAQSVQSRKLDCTFSAVKEAGKIRL